MTKRKRMPSEVWQQVFNRESGECLRCGKPGNVVHHRQGRGGKAPHTMPNCVLLCDPCHRHIHDHPNESYEHGWLVRRTGVADPAKVPIRAYTGFSVRLSPEGWYLSVKGGAWR